MKVNIIIFLLLFTMGGSAAAQCYQPTMNAARQAESTGNYDKAASLYSEAQDCYDASPKQKDTAKKYQVACRKKSEAAEQRRREEAERKEEARRQKEKEDELRRREEQLRKREEQIRQQEQQAAEQRKRDEAERKAEAQRQQAANRSNETIRVNGVEFTMVWVEGGTFTMGCTSEQGSDCSSAEKPTHSVTLSGYYIGETEVTQALWKAVMGTTVQQQRDKANPDWSLEGEGANYPMYYVNYDEALQFIKKLNALTGRTFSLPTEAEWEYAARGGNKSRGYKYAGSDDIGAVAWYFDNSGEQTHPVGQKRANELGLYDMSGNVQEWCSDWYVGYSSDSQTNPKGSSSGYDHVYRGGSCWFFGGWGANARSCRVSNRGGYTPSYRDYYLGFRLVLYL